LLPMLMPLAWNLLGGVNAATLNDPVFSATIGAILAGAIFGDHCSPISDTQRSFRRPRPDASTCSTSQHNSPMHCSRPSLRCCWGICPLDLEFRGGCACPWQSWPALAESYCWAKKLMQLIPSRCYSRRPWFSEHRQTSASHDQ
jgi:hypothetical protein